MDSAGKVFIRKYEMREHTHTHLLLLTLCAGGGSKTDVNDGGQKYTLSFSSAISFDDSRAKKRMNSECQRVKLPRKSNPPAVRRAKPSCGQRRSFAPRLSANRFARLHRP